jgi:hypothetical protein
VRGPGKPQRLRSVDADPSEARDRVTRLET